MALRNYSSTAQRTTTTGTLTNVATSVTVAATTGFPATPFIGILEPDTVNEEVVLVTNVATLTLTITRGYDSTTAVAHGSGATFQHGFAAIDFREANAFINPQAAETFSAWAGVTTGSIAIGAGLTTGALNLATAGTGATPIGIGHTNAVVTITGNTTIAGTLNPTNAADTATAASHYWVETGSDGLIRPKTLANVKTEILTNAALTSAYLTAPEEKCNIVAAALSSPYNFDILSGQTLYLTTASTAGSCTLNFRGNGSTTLATLLSSTGDTISCTLLVTTGASTPGFVGAAGTVQCDGTASGVTVKWMYGNVPAAGNASAIDIYTFVIIKTAAGYTVIGSVAKYA